MKNLCDDIVSLFQWKEDPCDTRFIERLMELEYIEEKHHDDQELIAQLEDRINELTHSRYKMKPIDKDYPFEKLRPIDTKRTSVKRVKQSLFPDVFIISTVKDYYK